MRIRLSATQIATADDCRRRHWYQSIAKVRPTVLSANLAFGRSLDECMRLYLVALAGGGRLPDPAIEFLQRWRYETEHSTLSYSSTQRPEDLERTGMDLMRALPGAWEATGFQIACAADGSPLIDVDLKCDLGTQDDIAIELVGRIDVMVYTEDVELAVLDVKSAVAAHSALYTLRSDQLTTYQVLVERNQPVLQLPRIRKLGFWDFLKRKVTSKVEKPLLVASRNAQEIREFYEKVFWIADDIRRRRFPKVSRMQFNTPCELCDFAQHCVYGEHEGLSLPAGFSPISP